MSLNPYRPEVAFETLFSPSPNKRKEHYSIKIVYPEAGPQPQDEPLDDDAQMLFDYLNRNL